MNNFGNYITVDQALQSYKVDGKAVAREELVRRSSDHSLCAVCGEEQIWRLVNTGMCFSCTTGESDASDDTELISRKIVTQEKEI